MLEISNWKDLVSRETISKLEKYDEILHKWQKAINLIGKTTLDDSWARHFEDSAQILPLLQGNVSSLADFGCGAGFPGLIVAVCNPDIHVTLVESDSRKCAFLSTVSRELGCKENITILNERVENIDVQSFDVITSRALSSLVELLHYSNRFVKHNPSTRMVFHKGEKFEEELGEARLEYLFDCDIYKSSTDNRGCVLNISSLSKI